MNQSSGLILSVIAVLAFVVAIALAPLLVGQGRGGVTARSGAPPAGVKTSR